MERRLLVIGAAILAALLVPMRAVANLLPVQRIRSDPKGDGHFGTSRTGHVHQGVDLVVVPGEVLTSPIAGKVLRVTRPYADDPDYTGVVLFGEGFEVKIFYCHLIAGLHVGDAVERGEPFAIAQDISAKYGGGMIPHIHVEFRTGGALLNPANVLSLVG